VVPVPSFATDGNDGKHPTAIDGISSYSSYDLEHVINSKSKIQGKNEEFGYMKKI
jgi:hypothetical protein